MKLQIVLGFAIFLAACGAPTGEVKTRDEAQAEAVPPPPNKVVFLGQLEGVAFESTRAEILESPDGLVFTAQGEDPNILITPKAPIDPASMTKIVMVIEKVEVPVGEFSLLYRTAERDFDGEHLSYASKWEDLSSAEIRLTFDFAASEVPSGWATAPITQLRFDPVPGSVGKVVIKSVVGEP